MTTIRRHVDNYVEVEIPEGHRACPSCKGAGKLSKYDQGVRSLVHSPELAALRTCVRCGGQGYVEAAA